jgi:hypothetical protein
LDFAAAGQLLFLLVVEDRISYSDSGFYSYRLFWVNAVNKGALHAKTYHSLLQNIPADAPVTTVIITLNLSSFNADWINSELETQLMQQNVMLQTKPPIVKRFMLAFKAYDDKTLDKKNTLIQKSWRTQQLVFPYAAKYTTTYDWEIALGNGSFLLEDGSWDVPKIQLATAYVKSYAFQIDTNNNPRAPPKQLMVRWQVFSTEFTAGPCMVVDVQRNGQSLSWQGFSLLNEGSKNIWSENAVVVRLPDELQPTDIIKIYAWNPSKSPVFIDDIRIEPMPPAEN